MIVDPWGAIIGACSTEHDATICYGSFDKHKLRSIRENMPLIDQRRPELYSFPN
jgi:predicted amidohydrolase